MFLTNNGVPTAMWISDKPTSMIESACTHLSVIEAMCLQVNSLVYGHVGTSRAYQGHRAQEKNGSFMS